MKKKLIGLLTICAIASMGLGFMESSGSVSVQYDYPRDSGQVVVSLPPPQYSAAELDMSRAPRLQCVSAIVIDNSTNQILYEKNSELKRPIASITKLLASVALVEENFDLTKKITITSWDANNSSASSLRIGEKFLAKDLFFAALICSDNRAIKALARSSGITYPEFIDKMNEKAAQLGMDSTSAVDPSGILSDNISTAMDVARLLNYTLRYPLIQSALSCQQYEFRSLNHKRLHRINNTNRLLHSQWKVAGGKTGYIAASGYCLAVRIQDEYESDITTVVLGSPSNGYRFSETRKIASWAFQNLAKLGGKR